MASSDDHQKLRGRRPGTVLVPQGPLTRGAAFFIDTLLVSLVLGLLLGDKAPLETVVAATLVADFLYFALSEGITGTTLGKRLFGLRVVRAADGRSCGPLAAIVRTALRLVDNLLFSLPGIAAIVTSPRRQRLGDRAARTLVVTEVPEQLLAAFDRIYGRATPDEVLRRINAATLGHAQPDLTPGLEHVKVSPDPAAAAHGETLPCPFCDVPMPVDEVVCRYCGEYVNQVTANGDAENMAPVPMLHSPDRRYRFDALWRLVFADDEASLAAVREAVPTWPRADRLLAVNAFAEVADPRPAAFLESMTSDPDEAVRALAREVRGRRAP
jgi:uncharacterized RDD family membrane protein YckC